jgi:hypothetical protein
MQPRILPPRAFETRGRKVRLEFPRRWLGARRRDEGVPRSARAPDPPTPRPEPRANVERESPSCGRFPIDTASRCV